VERLFKGEAYRLTGYGIIMTKNTIITDIENIPCLQQVSIRRKFFTLRYYGNVVDKVNKQILFNFRKNKREFCFQGDTFSGKWTSQLLNNWTRTMSGSLIDDYGNYLAESHVIVINEYRSKKLVIRDLFQIDTKNDTYLLWCLAELFPLYEAPHKLLVLSDTMKETILIRGRTESFNKEFHVLHNSDDIPILLPIYFNYYMIPPLPSC
jgi:hypothetical protein